MSNSNSRRIMLFMDASGVGGIEQHVISLANALTRLHGVEPVVVLWKDYGGTELKGRLKTLKCPVLFADGKLLRFVSLLRSNRIDVLHAHGYKANIISRLIRPVFEGRVVTSHHNGDMGKGVLRFYTLLDSWSSFLSENWVVSREIKERLPWSSRLMPNFVDTPSIDRSVVCDRIVFVGRLQSVKRPDRFLSIAHQCARQTFQLFGDGPLRQSLTLNKPDNVRLMGFQNDSQVIWEHAALLVICSDDEGLPLVALEAMAQGVPVLARAIGELPTLIDHGSNGWLVESDEDFVQAITHWFQLARLQRQQVSRRARQTIIDKYSVIACLPAFLEAYEINAR